MFKTSDFEAHNLFSARRPLVRPFLGLSGSHRVVHAVRRSAVPVRAIGIGQNSNPVPHGRPELRPVDGPLKGACVCSSRHVSRNRSRRCSGTISTLATDIYSKAMSAVEAAF